MSFTHASYNGMAGTRHQDYERLEYLGDSIIGMVISELCYMHHPEMGQGDLSVLKAQFIRTDSEAKYCLKLGLDKYIRVGISFQGEVAKSNPVLEDVFEAFIGALFLDQGLVFTHNFLIKLFSDDVKAAYVEAIQNPKSMLQEAMQADHKQSVTYKIIGESGPSHMRKFHAGVFFEGKMIGQGEGNSKKAAEIEAARNALSKMAITKKGK